MRFRFVSTETDTAPVFVRIVSIDTVTGVEMLSHIRQTSTATTTLLLVIRVVAAMPSPRYSGKIVAAITKSTETSAAGVSVLAAFAFIQKIVLLSAISALNVSAAP